MAALIRAIEHFPSRMRCERVTALKTSKRARFTPLGNRNVIGVSDLPILNLTALIRAYCMLMAFRRECVAAYFTLLDRLRCFRLRLAFAFCNAFAAAILLIATFLAELVTASLTGTLAPTLVRPFAHTLEECEANENQPTTPAIPSTRESVSPDWPRLNSTAVICASPRWK